MLASLPSSASRNSILLTAVLIATQANAQVFPPGTFSIDGIPVNCGGASTVLTQGLGDVAKAIPGRILIDIDAFQTLPTGVKLFVYAHECGHQIYGPNENTADCFAVKLGRNQGVIDYNVLQSICQSVYFSPGDWTHMPGPLRCQQMLACFTTP